MSKPCGHAWWALEYKRKNIPFYQYFKEYVTVNVAKWPLLSALKCCEKPKVSIFQSHFTQNARRIRSWLLEIPHLGCFTQKRCKYDDSMSYLTKISRCLMWKFLAETLKILSERFETILVSIHTEGSFETHLAKKKANTKMGCSLEKSIFL